MDISNILVNQNFLLFADFSVPVDPTKQVHSVNFTKDIKISFVPDYMVVRCITYFPVPDDTNGNYVIWSDLVSNYIGNFVNQIDDAETNNLPYVSTPGLVFSLANTPAVNGNFTFKIYEQPVTNVQSNLFGKLCINLDFIKLKKSS